MRAMLLSSIGPLEQSPLIESVIPDPVPGPGEVLLNVTVCGVCHTELDEIEGRTAPPRLPVVPGHQAIGVIEDMGEGVRNFRRGDRVGVSWIASACGTCPQCISGQENLCPLFTATGRDVHGGYAERMTVRADFAVPVPDALSDSDAAPLLCAGAIGLRSLRLTGLRPGQPLGLTGFGASAHLVLKMAPHLLPGSPVVVFSRSEGEQTFARERGAAWAGGIGDTPPIAPAAVIDTTPAWKPVLASLDVLAPGGRLVINAIRKEDTDRQVLDRLDYTRHIWMEKEIKSVTNVTRSDVQDMLALASDIGLRPDVQEYPFVEANKALRELRDRRIRGAKVLRITGRGRA